MQIVLAYRLDKDRGPDDVVDLPIDEARTLIRDGRARLAERGDVVSPEQDQLEAAALVDDLDLDEASQQLLDTAALGGDPDASAVSFLGGLSGDEEDPEGDPDQDGQDGG